MKTTALIIFYFITMNVVYGAGQKSLTYEQAAALALVAATTKGLPRPSTLTHKESEHSDKQANSKKFINFEIFYPNSSGAYIYSVNPRTGDVFMPPGLKDSCVLFPSIHMKEIKTKELAMIQKKARHTIHLTYNAYQRLRTQKPRCRDQSSKSMMPNVHHSI